MLSEPPAAGPGRGSLRHLLQALQWCQTLRNSKLVRQMRSRTTSRHWHNKLRPRHNMPKTWLSRRKHFTQPHKQCTGQALATLLMVETRDRLLLLLPPPPPPPQLQDLQIKLAQQQRLQELHNNQLPAVQPTLQVTITIMVLTTITITTHSVYH